jgi:gliding motility-associated-like protein
LWNTGSNASSISGLTAGTYTCVVTDAGCADTVKITITEPSKLQLQPSVTHLICNGVCTGGATINPAGGTPNYSYAWSNSANSAAVTGLCAGNYVVTVTDNNGCTHDTSLVITQPTPLTHTPSSTPASCGKSDGSASVTAGGGTSPYSYLWNNGQTSQTAINLSSGNYSVTITDASGCTAIETVSLNSGSSFSVTTTSTPAICTMANGSASATPTGGSPAFTYAWNNGETTQTITNLSAGTYTVTITDASGCSGTEAIIVPLTLSPPTGNFSSTPVCLGSVTQFTDNSAGNPDTWNWDFGNGNNSSLQNPANTYTAAGTYSVTLIVTNPLGCKDTVVLPVTVNPLPTAAIIPSSPCLGSVTQLNDGSVSPQGNPVTSWNWVMTGGNPASSTSQNTSTVYNTAGTNSVTLIVTTQSGCKDSITQQVVIYHAPIALFNDKDSGCAPVCHTFTDLSQSVDGNISNWAWSFPGGSQNTSSQTNPGPICYNAAGNYDGSLIVTTSYGCKDTLKLTNIIHVYAWPHADFCVDQNKAPATDPVFAFCPQWTPNPGVAKWMWNFGDGSPLDSTSTNPVHSYSAAATANDFYSYDVCLRVQNQFGCWDSICKTVELIPEFTFYIPNTFTPNGDHTNEFFFGKGRGIKDYNIWLFDRWGNMIWDCHYTGKNTDWDGSGQDGMPSVCKWDAVVVPGGPDMNGKSGQLAQEDVYVWKVKLTDVFNKQHNYIGHVSIVK